MEPDDTEHDHTGHDHTGHDHTGRDYTGRDYTEVNRAGWDERAAAHADSPDYQWERFVADPEHLSDVVRFDLPRLGDVSGLRGVHLQCHIGTDTLSLARLGARMTGLDFSGTSIARARELAATTGADADLGLCFVEADVDDAADVLPEGGFDLVYTGVGALCWLPSIRRWAEVAARLLAPGGRLFLREGHPVLWAIEDVREDGLLALELPYFEREEPMVFDEPGTYVATDHVFEHTVSAEWNHGIGETVTALLEQGFVLTGLEEHDSVPWDALPGMMSQVAGRPTGEFRLDDRPWRLPHSYTLQAVRQPGAT